MLATQMRVVAKDTPIVSFLPEYAIFAHEEAATQNAFESDRTKHTRFIKAEIENKADELKDIFKALKRGLLKDIEKTEGEELTPEQKMSVSEINRIISSLEIITPSFAAFSDFTLNSVFTEYVEKPDFDLLDDYVPEHDLSDVW
jgi:hypothetical protein